MTPLPRLAQIADTIETVAGATTPANRTRAGFWKRIALAAETLAGASTTANVNQYGWMKRTALALEAIAGSGGQTNTTNKTEAAYLKRIADALGAQGTGSWAKLILDALGGLTPPVNMAAPTITGIAQVGEELTATTGAWSGDPAPTYSYQWQRGTTDIGGATSSTYTLVSADVGSTVRVVVTATNSAGSASANSAGVGPVEGPELITPTVLEGVTIAHGAGGGTHTWDAETMTMETTVAGASTVYPRYHFPVGALDPAATYAMNLEAVDAEGRLLRASIALSINDATGSAAFANGVVNADVSSADEQTDMVVSLDGMLLGVTTFSTISLKRIA